MQSPKLHEQTFNIYLADALRESCSDWVKKESSVLPERSQPGSSKRADIYIDDGIVPRVIIECAYGEDDKDAISRINDVDFDVNTVFSVAIPKRFETMTDSQAKLALRNEPHVLKYALFQKDQSIVHRFPKEGYVNGSTNEFVHLIRMSATVQTMIDRVGSEVASLINDAANALKQGLLEEDSSYIAKQMHQHSDMSAFRIVAVMWLDAMLVQSRLRSQTNKIPALQHPLEILEIINAWRKIVEINWCSIFEPAIEVLERARGVAWKPTSKALNLLFKAVGKINDAQLGEHVNISAEIFPRISDDRKTSAAFYTTPSTAELLASLLIQENDRTDWHDALLFNHCKVGDLACGTGSLVRAAYRRIREFHEKCSVLNPEPGLLHKTFMEEGLTATDISPIATHLTNSSLALLGDGRPYAHTKIGWVSVGVPAETGLTTGSLEFLDTWSLDDLFGTLGDTRSGKNVEEKSIVVKEDSLDYVIMNPPYSRTRGGQSAFDVAGLDNSQRKLCQQRWAKLIKGKPATKIAGMAASFLCLAHRITKPGGKIGFVLPLTAAFAESWRVTRKMVVENFEDVVAITRSGFSRNESMSADTNMAEMLLIATKKKENESDNVESSSVQCVSLTEIPAIQGRSYALSAAITKALASTNKSNLGGTPILLGNECAGYCSEFAPVDGEPWSYLGVKNLDLAYAIRVLQTKGELIDVVSGKVHKLCVPIETIDSIFDVGPTHHLIGHLKGHEPIGAFEIHRIRSKADFSGANRMLWSTESKEQTSLSVRPTHKGFVSDATTFNGISSQAGHLHYQRGIGYASQTIQCAFTRDKVFGGPAWTSLILKNIKLIKAYSLWFNSTFGLLMHWSQGGRTQPGRSRTQVHAIKNIPCPTLHRLSAKSIDQAATEFERIAVRKLLAVGLAFEDSVRQEIDIAVMNMLEIPNDFKLTIDRLRFQWCSEPLVNNSSAAILKSLNEHEVVPL